MKLLLPLFIFISSTTLGQHLITNSTDEFTGKKIKETSIENLAQPFKMSGFTYKFSFKKVNDNLYLNLRIMSLSNSVFAIKDGEVLMLKISDTVLKLSNSDYVISKKGGSGAPGLSSSTCEGVSLYFPLTSESVDLLKSKPIVKIRLYTTDGFTEQEIKDVADKKVKNALALVL